MKKVIFQNISNVVNIIILIFVIVISVFDEFFSEFIQLETKHLLIVFAGILLAILIQQFSMQYLLIKEMDEGNRFLSVQKNSSDAYSLLFHKRIIIKNLRIYAISSRDIQANIAALKFVKIEQCTLLVRNLKKQHYLYTEQQSLELQMNLERWKMMVKNGNIEKLKVVAYNDISNDYCVIIDNKAMLGDTFFFDKNDTSGQNNFSPIIIKNNTIDGKEIIERYIYRFDNYVQKWENLDQSNNLLVCSRTDFQNNNN